MVRPPVVLHCEALCSHKGADFWTAILVSVLDMVFFHLCVFAIVFGIVYASCNLPMSNAMQFTPDSASGL